MNQSLFRFRDLWLFLVLLLPWSDGLWAAEPRVQILSPKDGSHITQEQNSVLISGKVATDLGGSPNVDIVFVIDISGSTSQYAGADFGDMGPLPDNSGSFGFGRPQISIGGMGGIGIGQPPLRNLRNSILAAEVAAARRLLLQLNSQTTRIGVVTFGEGAKVMQPLTHDFDRVRRVLDDILRNGPYGGTNMAEGIRAAISELMGLGSSEKRPDTIKVEFLLTDGFPTMPIGGGRRAAPEDTDFAINAARLAGKAAIKVHVFALGEEALSYPRAAVGIAKASGGTYTPVSRAADVLAVVENISVVGVDYVQIVNQTTGQKATQLRLAADGFFSSAVPVVEGRNQIDVFARASDGSTKRDSVSIFYQPGKQRSLDLEVFLEREKNLKLEVERLGRSPAEIQKEAERSREDSLGRSQQRPPSTEGPPR
ncbi:MAG TPA: VWA domain-containing protein [Candidatus Binatia bacterium]|nr:VWA domain-containing protein [Candidatus Binatia bacterium]